MKALASRAPAALGFLILSAVTTLIAHLSDTWLLLALYPPSVIERGFIWQLLTYSLVHTGVRHLLFSGCALVALAVFVEPVLGIRRSVVLMVCSAIVGGAAFLLLGMVPLLGSGLVANGVGASFVVLALLHRVPRTWPATAVFLACLGYAIGELYGNLAVVLAIVATWATGLVAAVRSARSAAA